MISGEMDPRSPGWLSQNYHILRQLGFSPVTSSENSGDQYALATEAVGFEYLRLCLTEPDQALESMGTYLHRFTGINSDAGIISGTTADQFGMIANIASLRYTTFERSRLLALHRHIDTFLSAKNSANIPGYTSKLRKPELLRDLVVHWSAIHWPNTDDYIRFLKGTSDWETVQQHIERTDNNPVLFALSVPLALTDPVIRLRFRDEYPELAQQGIDIIAARLFNRRAHDEILRARGSTPELKQWYEEHYKGWEESITASLARYAPEYRQDILRGITAAKWNIFPEIEEISFPKMVDKIAHTGFSLDEDGMLVRKTL